MQESEQKKHKIVPTECEGGWKMPLSVQKEVRRSNVSDVPITDEGGRPITVTNVFANLPSHLARLRCHNSSTKSQET